MQKDPISLVVFGATGDLMARKILPSLFYLYKEKKLPRGFRVIGVSRRDISEEGFRGKMRDAAGKFDEIAKDKRLAGFLKLFYFVKGYFRDRYTYEDLKRVLEGHDHKICFYLAVAPKFYKHVLENMQKAGLIHQNMSKRSRFTALITILPKAGWTNYSISDSGKNFSKIFGRANISLRSNLNYGRKKTLGREGNFTTARRSGKRERNYCVKLKFIIFAKPNILLIAPNMRGIAKPKELNEIPKLRHSFA